MRNPKGDLATAIAGQKDRLLPCVHCGFCLPACPTYTRLGDEADSPRGRLHLMQAVVEGRLDPGSDAFRTHIDRCLGCRACEPACPSGVEYGILLEHARETAVAARAPGLLTRILLRIMGSSGLRRPFFLGGRVLRATGLAALGVRLIPAWGPLRNARLGLAMLASTSPARWESDRRKEPALASVGPTVGPAAPAEAVTAVERAAPAEPLAGVGSAAPAEPAGDAVSTAAAETTTPAEPAPSGGLAISAESSTRRRIGMLTGCVQAGLYGRVNQATVRVLQANGLDVVSVPTQDCCGALHAHAGALEGARVLARRNIDAFEAAGVDTVAVNAAGCGASMKQYGILLEEDEAYAERAARFSARVYDIHELLADAGPRLGAEVPCRVAYDHPCHLLHAQGIRAAPLRVLDAVPGVEVRVVENADECCGGAGIYGITHPDLGGRIGGDKVQAVRAAEGDFAVTPNPGCMMQIGAGLRLEGSAVRAVHPVELLDESYRRAGYYQA